MSQLRTIVMVSLALGVGACGERVMVEPDGSSQGGPLASAGAPIVKDVPEDDPGPPWYTPVFGDGPTLPGAYIPNDGIWAAVVFWRDPGCVPADFDLLQLLNPPLAFACGLTVAGRVWFGPSETPPPLQERYWGLGRVPVAFVLLRELVPAMGDAAADMDADPDLYMDELTALPSFNIGYADLFRTVIQNSSKAANPGHEVVDARGTIEAGTLAGREFRYHHNERFDPGTGVHSFQNVLISFD